MGENHFAALPLSIYGFILLMASIAYAILQRMIIKNEGDHSTLAIALGKDWKGKLSPVLYLAAMSFAWLNSWISEGIYILVALLWLIPDSRIEHTLHETEK
jgi:uncharacterized membrane protein